MHQHRNSTAVLAVMVASVVATTFVVTARAANICDPADGGVCVSVDLPASGGNTAYSLLNRPTTKSTFRASTAGAGTVVAVSGTAPFACIYGSYTKTITVQRIFLSGATLTAFTYATYVVAKYSTSVSAGTATALVPTPMDSFSVASTPSILNVYTAAPTAGTLLGTIASKRTLLQYNAPDAGPGAIPDVVEFDLRTLDSDTSGVILRSPVQGVCVNFGAAPGSAVTMSVAVEWTEQDQLLQP